MIKAISFGKLENSTITGNSLVWGKSSESGAKDRSEDRTSIRLLRSQFPNFLLNDK
jgi:hypothetical protein